MLRRSLDLLNAAIERLRAEPDSGAHGYDATKLRSLEMNVAILKGLSLADPAIVPPAFVLANIAAAANPQELLPPAASSGSTGRRDSAKARENLEKSRALVEWAERLVAAQRARMAQAAEKNQHDLLPDGQTLLAEMQISLATARTSLQKARARFATA